MLGLHLVPATYLPCKLGRWLILCALASTSVEWVQWPGLSTVTLRISVKCLKQNSVGTNQIRAIIIKKLSQYHPHIPSKEQSQNLNPEFLFPNLWSADIDLHIYMLQTGGACFQKWMGDKAGTAEQTKEGTSNYKQPSPPMGFELCVENVKPWGCHCSPSTTQGAMSDGQGAHLGH